MNTDILIGAIAGDIIGSNVVFITIEQPKLIRNIRV